MTFENFKIVQPVPILSPDLGGINQQFVTTDTYHQIIFDTLFVTPDRKEKSDHYTPEVNTNNHIIMTTEISDGIAERLTFFFSDANLRVDRFMQKQVGREDDFGGSIPVETLLKFKSIQKFTTDGKDVLDAAKSLSDFLVVDGDSISRKEPMKKTQMDDNIPVSLHVSNVPVEDNKYTVTALDLRPLFEEYGKVMIVKLKWKPEPTDSNKTDDTSHYSPPASGNGNYQKRKMIPAGKCLVEFESVDAFEKAAADLVGEPPNKVLELKGNTLKVQKLRDWIDERKVDKPKNSRDKDSSTNNGGVKNSDSKHDDAKDGAAKRKHEEIEVKLFTLDWKPGCVIELKGLDAETCDRETLRETLKDMPDVYADYSRGQTEGAIRFPEPSEKVKEFAEKLQNGDVVVGGKKVESARVLDGDDEKAYWQKFIDFKNNQIRQKAEEKANKSKNKNNFKKRRRN
jgi:hypothetical protein